MTANDMRWLGFWLRTPTRDESMPGTTKTEVHVQQTVQDGEINLHLFHKDMSATSVTLKPDGTWFWTVGQ